MERNDKTQRCGRPQRGRRFPRRYVFANRDFERFAIRYLVETMTVRTVAL
jgi:hypothetical protein